MISPPKPYLYDAFCTDHEVPCYVEVNAKLTLILLTWRIWWAPNNASRWDLIRCLKD